MVCSPSLDPADPGMLGFLSCYKISFETLEPLLALEAFLELLWSARLRLVEQILAPVSP